MELVQEQENNFARNKIQIMVIGIDTIKPSSYNPRKNFNADALQELADSIKTHGLLEPIVVRPLTPTTWEIIAGERRWRASKMAGLTEIPVVWRTADDQQAQVLALVENLVRRDIDPVEEAHGFKALRDMGMQVQEIAQMVNRGQSTISNSIRLLDLPADVLNLVQTDKLSQSHGRALVSYVLYPEILKILTDAAIDGATSKTLESYDDARLPYSITCELRKHHESLETFNARFSAEEVGCSTCQHKRRRYCLHLECFNTLKAAAIAQAKAENEEQMAAMEDGGVIDLANYNSHDYKALYNTFPECSGCENAKNAKDNNGNARLFCFDPECHKMLTAAEADRVKAEKSAAKKIKINAMLAACANDAKAMYKLTAIAVLGSLRYGDNDIITTTAKGLNITTDVSSLATLISNSHDDAGKRELLDLLVQINPAQLVMFVAEMALRREIETEWSKDILNEFLLGVEEITPTRLEKLEVME